MAYSTLSLVKQYLNIDNASYDKLLKPILDAAIEYIEEYTGQSFAAVKTVVDEEHLTDELQGLKGKYILRVWHSGLTELDNVNIDTVDLNAANRSLQYKKYGLISFSGSLKSSSIIKVSYKYGTTETPAEINQALNMRCLSLAEQSNHPTLSKSVISSERVGDYQVNYSISLSAQRLDRVEKILNRYKYTSII